MTELATLDAYGVGTEPATVRMERMPPGPIERVWLADRAPAPFWTNFVKLRAEYDARLPA